MIRRFSSRYRSLLGIDVNPPFVNLLVLSQEGPVVYLEHFANQPFLADEDPYSNPKELVSCIKTLLQQHNIRDNRAIIAIPDSSIFSKTFQCLNSLTHKEIKEWLNIEAQKKLGAADITMDFTVLGENKSNPAMLDVLLVASHNKNITKRIEIMQQAGVSVHVVESESFAIQRILSQIVQQEFSHLENPAPIAVVIIGQGFKLFVFDQKKMIWFAEENFLENSKHSSDLCELLTKKIQFFFASTSYSTLHHIYIAGNTENITQLADKLEIKSHIATSVPDPFKYFQMKTTSKQKINNHYSSFLLASGMALRMQ